MPVLPTPAEYKCSSEQLSLHTSDTHTQRRALSRHTHSSIQTHRGTRNQSTAKRCYWLADTDSSSSTLPTKLVENNSQKRPH
ncbi:hypothetical protein AMECASPLE_014408 [Ameca splendens]|uniref:Uncharacterized protein n=1 Tax=Ameca splendens TaxID=208324 RepID=A0ABV0ZMH5_9TELE